MTEGKMSDENRTTFETAAEICEPTDDAQQQSQSQPQKQQWVYVAVALEQLDNGQDLHRMRQNSSSPSLSSDSAIGGSSPSSSCNGSSANSGIAGSDAASAWQLNLRLGYFIFFDENLDDERKCSEFVFFDLDSENAIEQLQRINEGLELFMRKLPEGQQAMLVATVNDIRQLLFPLVASTYLLKNKEDQDGFSLDQIPDLFRKFQPVLNTKSNEKEAAQCLEERLQNVLNLMKATEAKLETKTSLPFFLGNAQHVCGYMPGIFNDETADSGTIVRIRGLPWQATDVDIALFFCGLNIAPGGVALCLSSEGRRNGEALVRFENCEHRELSLQRHRKFLYSRYIEIYRATGEEFVQMAYGLDPEARRFAARKAAMIVRMRGLPFNCTEQQIREFFASDGGETNGGIVDEGVLFVSRNDGRPSGDAFVLFAEESVGKKALATKNKQRIGSRYIELFRTTQAEVQQLFNRFRTNSTTTQTSSVNNSGVLVKIKDCIRLRGLPYEAQVDQVVAFLGDHAKKIVFQGVHMIYTNQGQPSGEAFIQMDSEVSAAHASAKMHNKYMELGKKKRYIEVFQCSADDMNLMLSAAPLMGLGPQPQPLAPFMPFTLPQAANFLAPPVTTAIHPMGLIQTPPSVRMNSQIVHPPSLFPHHFSTISMSHSGELPLCAARGIAFPRPMMQFCAPHTQADLSMLNMSVPLQMLCQSNGFLRQSPSVGMETLYPPPLA